MGLNTYLDRLRNPDGPLCQEALPQIAGLLPEQSGELELAWQALLRNLAVALSDCLESGQQRSSAIADLGALAAVRLKKVGVDFSIIIKFTYRFREIFQTTATAGITLPETVLDAQSAFLDSFERHLASEWLHLETHKYHKKLREANRYILLEKRRYYTIFNRMAEPAFLIDEHMAIVDSNRAFKDFFGLPGKEHIGKLCYQVIGDEVCAACALEKFLAAQTSFSGIEAVVPVLGKMRTVLFSGTFLGDINNEYFGGLIIIQDITEKKENERALQEGEEHYRTLIENVPDVTWRADRDGRLIFVSPNVQRVCGYTAEEMTELWKDGRFRSIHADDEDLVKNEFGLFFASHLPCGNFLRDLLRQEATVKDDENVVDGRKKFDVKYRFQKKNGSWIWLHDRASKIHLKNEHWYTDGVFSDITELKKAEQELALHHFRLAELVDERTSDLRMANNNLKYEIKIRKQAEKDLRALAAKLEYSNQELEEFAHVASHDLKEPLMLVLAFGDRLLRKCSDRLDNKGCEYIKRIIKAANQMRQLVDDLLALSRISSEARELEEVDMNELVHEVIQGLEERIRLARGRVEVSSLGTLDGDRSQLHRLFQNIIANALKYRQESLEPFISIERCSLESDYCEIRVEDNGIGFNPEMEEHIFKPLTRLHRRGKYEGTGMGLATCQKIVVRHGGHISAKSSPGEGSVFIIRLPKKIDNY